MEDVRPDLDRLVTVATRQGTRIRRRTQLASLGGALGVAAVSARRGWRATGPAAGRPAPASEQLGFAGEPSTSDVRLARRPPARP